MKVLYILFALNVCVTAFVPSIFLPVRLNKQPSALNALITESEAQKVLAKANLCLEEECSLHAVNDLLVEMRTQQQMLKTRLEQITELVTALTAMNLIDDVDGSASEAAMGRDIDEMKESIKSIARVFTASAKSSGNDYPELSFPSGWTGEKNKGKSTAYDRNMS